MIGIPIGLAYANAGEWLLHKYVLHRLGKKRDSFWRFHWLHHGQTRRHDFRDPDYEQSLLQWNAQAKEALSLCALGVLHLPLLPVAPWFTLTALYSTYDYYRKHKRAHLDPGWAREYLPWHWDHHLGPNPEANYCVTRPWLDDLLGTREPLASRA